MIGFGIKVVMIKKVMKKRGSGDGVKIVICMLCYFGY